MFLRRGESLGSSDTESVLSFDVASSGSLSFSFKEEGD